MRRVECFGSMNWLVSVATECLADEIARDAAQPGTQLGWLTQMREFFPSGNERILRDVLTLAHAAGGTVAQRADQRLITFDDLSECISLTCQAAGHQLSIAVFQHGD